MQVEKISINKERLVFQLILNTDNQQEVAEFLGSLQFPTMISINCKIFDKNSKKEARLSIKCTTKEAYKEFYKQLERFFV